ncbi:hypothetical protein PM082_006827 [Marasmius tenuissimus]|nr:hypothetical protein PM082_006827 [Marasmius tenuissimus]
MMAARNTPTGGVMQSNYSAVNQNINNGRDQIFGGEVYNIGGDLIKNFTTVNSQRTPHERLWDAIAGVGASHNAEHQFSRGECLEGTRQKALRTMCDWVLATEQDCPMAWVSGAAGVGKTAIAITLAKSWEEDGLVSSFFFFRSDPKRNNPSALWLTIALGLVTRYPSCKAFINKRISDDPRILEARLEDQFRELVLKPVLEMNDSADSSTAPKAPNIIIIDGLDECGDEDTQLRILSIIQSAFQENPHLSFRFLIISRPEAWIREAFTADPLRQLTRFVVLDDTFLPDRDILRYYLHHFQEIVSSPKYRQVQFLDPWPSEEDLEALVKRACGQFIFAATLIKFLKLAFNHPVTQLNIILRNTPNRWRGKSPYPDLDALYHVILSANTNYDQVLPILAVILVLPGYMNLSPACIEWFLGLPSGQVSLTLRAMYSVLDIRGPEHRIRIYHTSFEEYLVDQNRSCDFHIDVLAQKYVLARQWLRNLSANRMRSYRFDLLSVDREPTETGLFRTKWIEFFGSIPKPTKSLLDGLRNLDLASVFFARERRHGTSWPDMFLTLVSWVGKYDDSDIGLEDGNKSDKDAYENSAHLVRELTQRLSHLPNCFHLERPPGMSPQDDVAYMAVLLERECSVTGVISEDQIRRVYSRSDPQEEFFHITECHCDVNGGKESDEPHHLAYQNACREFLKAHMSKFDMLAGKYLSNVRIKIRWLRRRFEEVVDSPLLYRCRVDAELLSYFQTFFKSAQNCSPLNEIRFQDHGREARRRKLLEWTKVSAVLSHQSLL